MATESSSKLEVRTSPISGKGTKCSIMQCLEDIDEKILGPNGKKASGAYLDENEFLDGFLDGFNAIEKEENFYNINKHLLKFLLVGLIFFLSYLNIVLLF